MFAESKQVERLRPLFFLPKILTFHKLLPKFSWGITNYAPGRLKQLLTVMSDRGYRFIPLEELLSRQPDDGVAITIDDGYHHLREVLPPLMDRFGIRPTVLVPTACVGRSNSWDYSHSLQNVPHLDSSGIKELSSLGIRFGSHGHSHTDLTRLDDTELMDEMERSRGILEDITGTEVTAVSYPFGRCNDRVAGAASAAGYQHGFTMAFPRPGDQPLAIGRHAVYGVDTCRSVLRKLTPGSGRRMEQMKCRMINACAIGTITLNRLRRQY